MEMDPKQLMAMMAGNKDSLINGLPGIDEGKTEGGGGGKKEEGDEVEKMVSLDVSRSESVVVKEETTKHHEPFLRHSHHHAS